MFAGSSVFSFDLPLLRYAQLSGGGKGGIALMKVDVMSECKVIKICTHYVYTGPWYQVGAQVLRSGDQITTAIVDSNVLSHCEPQYISLPGWCCSLDSIETAEDLPSELRRLIGTIESHTSVHVDVLSFGADRNATIVL